MMDNKLAYMYNMSFNPSKNTSANSIWTIDLDVDKISALSTGNDKKFVSNSQWPIYFARGTRSLPTSIKIANSASDNQSCNVYPNPMTGDARLKFISTEQTNAQIKISTAAGQIVYTNTIILTTGDNDIPINLPANTAAGYYIITIDSGDNQWVSRFVKM